jgi:hypothetical protein
MQTLSPSSPSLVVRPFRHLRDLWLVAAVFLAVKAAPGGVDKQMSWGLGAFAALLATVWAVGRVGFVQRLFEALLETPHHSANPTLRDSNSIGPRLFSVGATSPQSNSLGTGLWLWLIAGFLLVAGLLGYLEWRQPYYFVQDDNLSQFFPIVLQGCRSLLHDGVFPTWNPHQFMGSPTASLGTYALTYPPTYVSYAIANWLLGNEYATLDVFCVLHLLAAYFAMFWACRVMEIRPSLGAAAGACFALAGFFLIAGRSWYYMTPVALWAPLLVGLLERYRRGEVGGKWVLATGFVLGMLFHAGNAQMWAYTVLFYVIAVAIFLACRAVNWSHVFPAIAALLICGAIAAPLLIAQYAEISGLPRRPGDSSMLKFLPTMFLPYPLAKAEFPGVPETPDFNHMGHMNYSGTVFSVVAALGMLSFIAYRWNRRTTAANVWLLMAWLALLFTFGRTGGLWYLLSKIPPFTSFKHPFKFMGFATLFMVLGGAMLLERALRHWGVRRRGEIGVCVAAAGLIAYHATMATVSFCDYTFRPFPKLPAEMQQFAAAKLPQRIHSIGPRRSLSSQYAMSMMHQLPSVYGCYALQGYDPLVSASPRITAITQRLYESESAIGLLVELGLEEIDLDTEETRKTRSAEDALLRLDLDDHGFWGRSFRVNLTKALKTLRAYGVRWVAVYSGPQCPEIAERSALEYFWKTDPVVEQLAEVVQERGAVVVNRPEVRVYELTGAAPMSFAVDSPRKALPVTMNTRGLTVDTSTLLNGGEVCVNVLESKFLQAEADGVALEKSTDRWGRLLFEVPPGTKQLKASYRPPFLAGTLLGLLLAAVAYAVMRFRNRLREVIERRLTQNEDATKPQLVSLRCAA